MGEEKYADTALRIPMSDKIRSLNLSNTAALLIYEALRQQNFQIFHKLIFRKNKSECNNVDRNVIFKHEELTLKRNSLV